MKVKVNIFICLIVFQFILFKFKKLENDYVENYLLKPFILKISTDENSSMYNTFGYHEKRDERNNKQSCYTIKVIQCLQCSCYICL